MQRDCLFVCATSTSVASKQQPSPPTCNQTHVAQIQAQKQTKNIQKRSTTGVSAKAARHTFRLPAAEERKCNTTCRRRVCGKPPRAASQPTQTCLHFHIHCSWFGIATFNVFSTCAFFATFLLAPHVASLHSTTRRWKSGQMHWRTHSQHFNARH